MKRTFAKNMEGAKENELTEDAILNAIPVDARDGLIDINKPDGSFGRYTWYVKFAPFSDEEAKEAANGIKEVTGRRTQVAGFGREIYVLIMDYPSRPTSESRKLVKEGAGAGYDVGISELEIGEVTDIQKDDEFGYTFTAKIVPGTYEISAEDYYNDFFWQEHELGITPKAKIDGGEIHGTICPWEDTDDPEFWIQRQVEGSTFNLSFMYGAGWMHVDLPEDGQIYVDEHLDITPELYFSIDDIHLDAIDLVQAVNSGHASIFDRDEEEDEDEEPVDESTEAAKINLTWDEFNKLCDLIDMDWKRWNKNNAKSIPLVADRAVEHLEWITNKKLNGLDPKNVTISFTIPGSGIDEYDTGTQNTQTIYELIEGMAWDNYNPYNESALGRRNSRKSDESRRIDESYDDAWVAVGAGFDEFRQRLWRYTRKDMNSRRDAFSLCMNKCEEALKEYRDAVMSED